MDRLYIILGCTASGKGALGREIARRVGGRIVSVDSMKIYRRMDIGTAKPPAEVRAAVPHYCLDLVEPWEAFSVAQYVEHADAAVAGIRAAGAVPLAVGGTSLYLKALTEGLFEGPSSDAAFREELQARAAAEGLGALHAELAGVDPAAGARIHPNDARRIVRALEVYRHTGRPISSLQRQWENERRYDCVLIGLRREKEDLHRRINLRVRKMVEAGLLDEVRALRADPRGIAPQAAQAVGCAEVLEHLRGRCSFDAAVEQIKINTRRLAKKQRTWQRRFRGVTWIDVEGDEFVPRAAERVLAAVNFT